ncbi:MAG TPA: MmgE/PrpD family protein [Firmicutes bacterium]|nr:MmgE/PrpD family protein [Bacillota bacterium]
MESRKLAEFAADIRFEDIPLEVREKAKLCLLDCLASILGSYDEPAIAILRETIAAQGIGDGTATAPAFGLKLPPMFAALLNSAMSQARENDDFHKKSICHIGSTTIPPAIAFAEANKKGGRDLLTAIVAGYEVGIRVGEAINPDHHKIWHTTGTCGTFGAAVSVGKLLCLDAGRMNMALGTAGTQAAGLNQYMIDGGEMSKPLHAGKAAFNGYLAADLAARGFTGAERILEGDKGFCRATTPSYDLGKLIAGLAPIPEKFKISEVTQRLFPVNGHILSVLDALFSVLAGKPGLKAEDIEEIDVGLYHEGYNFLTPVEPRTPFLARFSVPFCVAIAVLTRKVDNESFTPATIADPRIAQLSKKVRLHEDPELTRVFPTVWSAKVRVVAHGETLDGYAKTAKGDPSNPLTLEDVAAKFQKAAGRIFDDDRVQRILERCMAIDELEDVSHLFD